MNKFTDNKEREYTFKLEGVLFGEKVKGNFEARYPSILDELLIDIEASKRLGGADPDMITVRAVNVAHKIAYLEVLLTKRPLWFDFEKMDSYELLDAAYEEVFGFVKQFRSGNAEDKHIGAGTESVDEKAVEGK